MNKEDKAKMLTYTISNLGLEENGYLVATKCEPLISGCTSMWWKAEVVITDKVELKRYIPMELIKFSAMYDLIIAPYSSGGEGLDHISLFKVLS